MFFTRRQHWSFDVHWLRRKSIESRFSGFLFYFFVFGPECDLSRVFAAATIRIPREVLEIISQGWPGGRSIAADKPQIWFSSQSSSKSLRCLNNSLLKYRHLFWTTSSAAKFACSSHETCHPFQWTHFSKNRFNVREPDSGNETQAATLLVIHSWSCLQSHFWSTTWMAVENRNLPHLVHLDPKIHFHAANLHANASFRVSTRLPFIGN